MKGYIIGYFVIMAAIIGYGIILLNGVKNMAPWTDRLFLPLCPLAILCGVGLWLADEIWTRQKAKKKQENKK